MSGVLLLSVGEGGGEKKASFVSLLTPTKNDPNKGDRTEKKDTSFGEKEKFLNGMKRS
jgi:hypothetical protein